MERWLGRSPKALLSASDFLTLQALQRRWAAVRLDQNQYIQTLVPDRLNDDVSYSNATPKSFGGRCFMCSTIPHRGQVTTLLRQMEAELAGTDFGVYYDQAA